MIDATTTQVTRRLRFCAAHRVMGHEDGCDNIHGHNWELWVTCSLRYFESLDSVGRVIDFKEVKKRLQTWIDANLDHACILNVTDPVLTALKAHKQKLYWVPFNPTVENLVTHFADIMARMLPGEIQIRRMKLVETENCFVEWSNDGR